MIKRIRVDVDVALRKREKQMYLSKKDAKITDLLIAPLKMVISENES